MRRIGNVNAASHLNANANAIEIEEERSEIRESVVVPRLRRVEELGQELPVADALVRLLEQLGVKHAFGVLGGAIVPFCRAVDESSIRFMQFRHEAGAAFAAAEASLASGRPVVVYATTGPGITNSITGLVAARWEGARVIFVSATTSPGQRGRVAFQETSDYAGPGSGFFGSNVFQLSANIESPADFDEVARRLENGFSRPGGYVAHVSFSLATQTAKVALKARRANSSQPPGCDQATVSACVERLARAPFVIWLGYGARDASEEILMLAERTGAEVICSPRAKGIFPESHPQFVGVTGIGGHAWVEELLAMNPPAHMLVLGSRLGEATSSWDPAFVPSEAFVHVDVDSDVFGNAYPNAETVGIQCEVGAFVRSLLASWPSDRVADPACPRMFSKPAKLQLRAEGAVRPQVLMAEVQRMIVDGSDAIVLAEPGNSFLWANHYLTFEEPGRYRTSTSWASMGHTVTGVVGAAIGANRKAVALVGDGAMLMQNEVSTAVAYNIPAVWIVLNDALLGMVDEGMRRQGLSPLETELPRNDFVQIARGLGAQAVRVENELELERALELALLAKHPFVIDVIIDRDEKAPIGSRAKNLDKQWTGKVVKAVK